MVFRFLILSDEVDDFKREIKIDSEATFLDLYNAIMDSVGYTKDQMCSFFICDDDWSKNTEITLVEMDTSSEVDNYIMEDTRLEELLEDEHQKLLFVFDYMTERAFFMELREIIPGKDLDKAVCSKSIGEAPVQIMSFDEMDAKTGRARRRTDGQPIRRRALLINELSCHIIGADRSRQDRTESACSRAFRFSDHFFRLPSALQRPSDRHSRPYG